MCHVIGPCPSCDMQKLELEHYFIKARLQYSADAVSAELVKTMAVHAMKELFGQVGASIAIDILKVVQSAGKENEYDIILRVPYSELSRVWSALTLLGTYNSKPVLYTVIQVSASLCGLAVSSRAIHCSPT